MEDNIFDKVHEVDLKKTMETSYIDYECYCFPCASRCKRRVETCTEKNSLLHDRAEQWTG